ncbi:hypothetical protein BDN71DRAFT_1484635 [Pleurotus eryngii]|uniref:Uncharacterized protein n=1 Tax=Pleurotus eryngii TaxID=5323 RepID=A0A9P6DBZ8_PLEER|nr:hypothetical protein BDN71DRAFT_1484635 [Pleurotus eryngii]
MFPCADIHGMLSMDLLHQVIKGTFKDHLVDRVVDHINAKNTPTDAARILADIVIATASPFPSLQQFPNGQNFKQWTGDDSKALMKVFIPAIAGHVPNEIITAIHSFTEFCYLVWCSTVSATTLSSIQIALDDCYQVHDMFKTLGIQEDFSLPRQHSIFHYPHLIQEFCAPKGISLCQILITNQRLDKLVAARIYFETHGMLTEVGAVTSVSPAAQPSCGQVNVNEETLDETVLAKVPQGQQGQVSISGPLQLLAHTKINVYHLAISTYHALSDLSGPRRMHCEHICATPQWYEGIGRCYDCILLSNDPEEDSFQGLHVTCLKLLFSFKHYKKTYPCTLIHCRLSTAVVHLDTVLCDVHLIGAAGSTFLPEHFTFSHTFNAFTKFYVNKYADYHSHKLLY